MCYFYFYFLAPPYNRLGWSRIWKRLSDAYGNDHLSTSWTKNVQIVADATDREVVFLCSPRVGFSLVSWSTIFASSPHFLNPLSRRNRESEYLPLHRSEWLSVGREKKCFSREREKAHRQSLVLSRVKVHIFFLCSSIFYSQTRARKNK